MASMQIGFGCIQYHTYLSWILNLPFMNFENDRLDMKAFGMWLMEPAY